MAKDISKSQIWLDLITQLNRSKVDYTLVDAAALVVHGLPRTTVDIDIHVPADKSALETVFKVADQLGLKSQQRAILKLSDQPNLFVDQWICFSHQGEDVLDVYFAPQDDFAKLHKKAKWLGSGLLKMHVASLEDIEAMKKAAGRAVDKADLELIKEAKKPRRYRR